MRGKAFFLGATRYHLCIRIRYRYLSHDKRALLQRNIILRSNRKRFRFFRVIIAAKTVIRS